VAEMTRQEMAANGALNQLDYVASELHNKSLEHADAGRDIDSGHSAWESQCVAAAAAELRKNCAGCEHFARHTRQGSTMSGVGVSCDARRLFVYEHENTTALPVDGSGHCHEWSAK